MAVHPPQELLIHILDPNRSVEGNYRSWTVTTDDGRVVTGLLAAESRTAVELVDAEGKRHPIQRDEIDEFQPSPNSLMPVGFEKQIQPKGFADLLAFLTAKGKYVPLPLDKAATVVTTKGMFFEPEGEVERLIFPDWKPKMVGAVPFVLVDPQGDTIRNAVMLHGPQGKIAPQMPKAVSLPLGSPAVAIHILGGISGWGWPATNANTVTSSGSRGLLPGARWGFQPSGLNDSAAVGSSSAPFFSATMKLALAVIPGSSAPSGLAAFTMTV